jgi:PD-(D/E)XK nuclease superfamily
MEELHKMPDGDNAFTAKCRLQQSTYREKVLGESAYGNGPYRNSENQYGNYLVKGEESGKNFLTQYIFQYAKSKVLEKQVNPDLTIDDYRLFNNMLSSMPMAFNLFGLIRKFLEDNHPVATEIIKSAFPHISWIDKVTYLDVEFIPRPISNYTNDKSAFDVMILAVDEKGKEGIISIETKYTDLLGSNTSKNRKIKDQLAIDEKIFDPKKLEKGYSQLARNFLLTIAYKKAHKLKYFEHIILSPKEDHHSLKEIDDFKQILNNKYKDKITKLDLEEFVDRTKECNSEEYRELLNKFKKRYLDFSLVSQDKELK